jgi:glutaconate CoA-transferase subunit B
MKQARKSTASADDFTVDELMVTTLAAFFRDGDQVCNGMASFIPVAAFMLARATHAPGLVWFASSIGLDPRPSRIPDSTLEASLWSDAVMYLDQYRDFWNIVGNGRWITKFCVGAAQLDQFGNANNSVIGDDYHAPKVRLPGTAGLADMCSLNKKLYYWIPNHSPRSLVSRVDYISGAGYLGGGDERERLGLGHGPQAVITNLAVLDFEPNSKRMRLVSLHPGVTLDQVQKQTEFDLLIPDTEIPETVTPSEEHIRLVREEIDPDGMRRHGFPDTA